MTGVKTMLGVRTTTPNLLCLLEAGLPSVQAMVREKQARFLQRMSTRQGMLGDPLGFALELTRQDNRVMNSHLEQVMNAPDHIRTDKEELMERVRSNEGSKYRTYCELNPELSVHPLYLNSRFIVEDSLRITFTRFRLSSHRLRVELGRWSRTPRDQRLCRCGTGIQDEQHLLLCPQTQEIRESFNYHSTDLYDLFQNMDKKKLCILSKCLAILEREHVS